MRYVDWRAIWKADLAALVTLSELHRGEAEELPVLIEALEGVLKSFATLLMLCPSQPSIEHLFSALPNTGRAFADLATRLDSGLEKNLRLQRFEFPDNPKRFQVLASVVIVSILK